MRMTHQDCVDMLNDMNANKEEAARRTATCTQFLTASEQKAFIAGFKGGVNCSITLLAHYANQREKEDRDNLDD